MLLNIPVAALCFKVPGRDSLIRARPEAAVQSGGTGSLSPTVTATRVEVAAIIDRLEDKIVQ